MDIAVWLLIALPLAGAVILLLGGRATNAYRRDACGVPELGPSLIS